MQKFMVWRASGAKKFIGVWLLTLSSLLVVFTIRAWVLFGSSFFYVLGAMAFFLASASAWILWPIKVEIGAEHLKITYRGVSETIRKDNVQEIRIVASTHDLAHNPLMPGKRVNEHGVEFGYWGNATALFAMKNQTEIALKAHVKSRVLVAIRGLKNSWGV